MARQLFALERPRRDERYHNIATRAQVLEDLARLEKDVRRKEPSYAALLVPSERPPDGQAHAGRLAQVLDVDVSQQGPLQIFPLSVSKEVLSVFKVSRDMLDGEDHSAKVKEHEALLERQALAASRKGQGKTGERRAQGPGNTRMSTMMGGKAKGEARGAADGGGGRAGGRGEKRGSGAGGARRKGTKQEIDRDARRRGKVRARKVSTMVEPVVERLWGMNDPTLGNPFRAIIDRNSVAALNVPDYFDYVSKPMNLQWMREKTKKREYGSVAAFEDDLRLMVDNARKYNGEGSAITAFADQMLQNYDTELRVDEPLDSDVDL